MWATSAALHEPVEENGYAVLKGPSATESFAAKGVDHDQNKAGTSVTSVKSAQYWEDIEKQQKSATTVEVPAAGQGNTEN
jgi:hypothetical protein